MSVEEDKPKTKPCLTTSPSTDQLQHTERNNKQEHSVADYDFSSESDNMFNDIFGV